MGLKLKGKYADRVQGIEGNALEKLVFKNIRECSWRGASGPRRETVTWKICTGRTEFLLLLQSLYRLAEKYRILFINLFRPGYWQGEDPSMDRLGELLPNHYFELNIQPLDRSPARSSIGNLLGIQGLPYTLRLQIIERSSSDRFFIEEVVRSLIDDGAIVGYGGSFEVTDKITSVVVPVDHQRCTDRRIDRLEEQTREGQDGRGDRTEFLRPHHQGGSRLDRGHRL